MLKSRRGLLAAGLAVAVVGALGVASTLNAGAEQITAAPDNQTPVADTPTGATGTATPPSVLPWGERPTRISKGRAGADSRTLRAAGVDAAAADTSGATQPRGRYAPKGRSDRTSALVTEKTDVPPPLPPSAKADEEYKVNYIYNRGRQEAETDGVYANLFVAKPWLAEDDYHSLAEVALQSADGKQIVEIGWTVDRLTNGDDDPHLFVYHWVNREESCYNGCGFVQYSKNIKPGDTLADGAAKKFGIQYSNGSWWVAFDSEWIGYFPEQLWNDEGVKFNRSGLIQVFGEVAASGDEPCTDMGTSANPTVAVDDAAKNKAAYISNTTYINGPAVALNYKSSTDSKNYGIEAVKESPKTFRYGGDGFC